MNQMTKPAAAATETTSSSLARTDVSSVEVQPLTDVFVSLESIQPGLQLQFLACLLTRLMPPSIEKGAISISAHL